MEWIRTLQSAIDYIEEHILEPINYEDAAKSIYTSSFNFHRTFSLLTGMTANEYIRNRRLSMAGQELSASNHKVIDIALKYGYDSPESFTKAFTRFHGITPNVARRSGASLKLFNRLMIKIKVEGGMIMDYRIEKKNSFKLLSKAKAFKNEIINEENNTEIPDFWSECGKTGVFDVLHKDALNHDTYGLCSPMSKELGCFDYGVGVECKEDTIAPEGFNIWTVREGLWAVFKCIGENGSCIGDVWEKIFSEFLPQSEYEMLEETDFEFYPENTEDGVFCEVWVPVVRK
jgi:AraC family transcriptional regulator